jgi:hypothetical protein
LDTRFGNGGSGPVSGGGELVLQVTGRGGVPASDVAAVVLNVTVVGPTAPGYITAFPTGTAAPLASNLNFTAGQVISNLVTVKVGTDGKVSFRNGSPAGVHLIADVAGFYLGGTAVDPGTFAALSPARLLDTRVGNGAAVGPVPGGGEVALQVTGRGGVPSTGVAAVVLNVTVTDTGGPGYVTVWPAGMAPPLASNLNFTAGQTIPNLVTVKVGFGGRVGLKNGSALPVHLIADVAGYYLAGTPSKPGTFVALDPARLLDTRASGGAVDPYTSRTVVVSGQGGVPATGAVAAVLNVTVTQPASPGYITAFPAGHTVPPVSSLNFTAGQTLPNLAIVALGGGGDASLFNGSPGTSHLIADVAGYFRS